MIHPILLAWTIIELQAVSVEMDTGCTRREIFKEVILKRSTSTGLLVYVGRYLRLRLRGLGKECRRCATTSTFRHSLRQNVGIIFLFYYIRINVGRLGIVLDRSSQTTPVKYITAIMEVYL